MSKQKDVLKGIVIGVLMTVVVLGGVTAVVAASRTIEITHGVRVVVDGVPQNFAEDMQPFIAVEDSRTFLPVRGIADSLGVDVRWDGATQTVYLTRPTAPAPVAVPVPIPTPAPAPTGTPLMEAAPWFERSTNTSYFTEGTSRFEDPSTVTMRGESFTNALSTRSTFTTEHVFWSHHDLNGRFNTFTGVYGRVDGTGEMPRNLLIIGDGVELASFRINSDSRPTEFSVDVTGVTTLRLEITAPAVRPGVGVGIANAMLH